MSEGTRERIVCQECGGCLDTPDSVSPSLWCFCPTNPPETEVSLVEDEDYED